MTVVRHDVVALLAAATWQMMWWHRWFIVTTLEEISDLFGIERWTCLRVVVPLDGIIFGAAPVGGTRGDSVEVWQPRFFGPSGLWSRIPGGGVVGSLCCTEA